MRLTRLPPMRALRFSSVGALLIYFFNYFMPGYITVVDFSAPLSEKDP